MVLKELVKNNKNVVILLNEKNRKKFLRQAKREGFKWIENSEIRDKDECFFHVSIKDNFKIANISAMCFVVSKELKELPVYEF